MFKAFDNRAPKKLQMRCCKEGGCQYRDATSFTLI